MSGRHGGRVTEHAGMRDFIEASPLSVILRTMGRRGGRENCAPNLAIDQENCEWVSVRYGVWQGLRVGKTYAFNGRKGKVVDKKENAGKHSTTGLPRVCVEWKDAFARDSGFNTSDHPRDKGGQFTSSGSEGGYSSQLKEALHDNDKFDGLISKLRADKSVPKEALRTIAKELIGFEPKKSLGREELIKEMTQHQMVRARQKGRAENIDKWAGKSW